MFHLEICDAFLHFPSWNILGIFRLNFNYTENFGNPFAYSTVEIVKRILWFFLHSFYKRNISNLYQWLCKQSLFLIYSKNTCDKAENTCLKHAEDCWWFSDKEGSRVKFNTKVINKTFWDSKNFDYRTSWWRNG